MLPLRCGWNWLAGALAAGLVVSAAASALSGAEKRAAAPQSEWRAYGGDLANTKYSSLDQIDRTNVARLQVAWRWRSPDAEVLKGRPNLQTWIYEATPLMVGGVLYTSTSLSQVAAIEPTTGRTLWTYDPKSYEAGNPTNNGFVHRGVAYWTDGAKPRLFIGTGDARLIALDAHTGQPVPEFGQGGQIDLKLGLGRRVEPAYYSVTSPPIVCGGTVVVGSSILDYPALRVMPPGDVRGFDARTGRLRWTFHATARDNGEKAPGTDVGAANVWTVMSADEARGLVYLPFSTPTNDFYGGRRPGDNLYAESLVCVEATTGKRVWHHQLVHHGLWDYDPPAAPTLVDLRVDGKTVPVVAQVTKQGFCFVFDRVTGKPRWPIEERPVPQSTVPGEATSATQPFPTRPAPFDRQGVQDSDLIDFTPELHAEALSILKPYLYGPLYTPPTERGSVNLPGYTGGASWAGAALDPESGRLFIPSITSPLLVTLGKIPGAGYVGTARPLAGPRGLPLCKPPYGRITAIDLGSGNTAWTVPLGDGPRNNPALRGHNLPRLGWDRRGFPLATRTLLFMGQEGPAVGSRPADRRNGTLVDFVTHEPRFRAFDKATGEQLWEMNLPANAGGAPMTYQVNGKQYIAVPVGGSKAPAELVALALP